MRRSKSRGNDSPACPSGISLDSLAQPADSGEPQIIHLASFDGRKAELTPREPRVKRHHQGAIAEVSRWAAQTKHQLPCEVQVKRSHSRFEGVVYDPAGRPTLDGRVLDDHEMRPLPTGTRYHLMGAASALTSDAVFDVRQRIGEQNRKTSCDALSGHGAHATVIALCDVEIAIAQTVAASEQTACGWLMKRACWKVIASSPEVWITLAWYQELSRGRIMRDALTCMLLWIYPKGGVYGEDPIEVRRTQRIGKRTETYWVEIARTPASFVRQSGHDLSALRELLSLWRPGYAKDGAKLLTKTLSRLHDDLLTKIALALKDNATDGERWPERNSELLAKERRRRNVLRMRRVRRRVKMAQWRENPESSDTF